MCHVTGACLTHTQTALFPQLMQMSNQMLHGPSRKALPGRSAALCQPVRSSAQTLLLSACDKSRPSGDPRSLVLAFSHLWLVTALSQPCVNFPFLCLCKEARPVCSSETPLWLCPAWAAEGPVRCLSLLPAPLPAADIWPCDAFLAHGLDKDGPCKETKSSVPPHCLEGGHGLPLCQFYLGLKLHNLFCTADKVCTGCRYPREACDRTHETGTSNVGLGTACIPSLAPILNSQQKMRCHPPHLYLPTKKND